MSVTFSAYTLNDDGLPVWICPEGWNPEYENDPDYGKVQTNSNPYELNVSNENYVSIMSLLEWWDGEYCGDFLDAQLHEFRDKLASTLKTLEEIPEFDEGTASEVDGTPGRCMMIKCGRRQGYYKERLSELLTIVNVAIEKGATLSYG